MHFEFAFEVMEWRGPVRFFFTTPLDEVTRDLDVSASHLSYGWGCISVDATIGNTTF